MELSVFYWEHVETLTSEFSGKVIAIAIHWADAVEVACKAIEAQYRKFSKDEKEISERMALIRQELNTNRPKLFDVEKRAFIIAG